MTTQRQAAVNRQNARKSTGPRTATGKAAAALNAMQLGPSFEGFLLSGESRAEFIEYSRRLRTDLAPFGAVEHLLVDRVIKVAWSLQRLNRFEAALFASEGNAPERAFDEGSRDTTSALFRREAALERSLQRTLHELQRIQAARFGAFAPRSRTIDVAATNDAGSEPDAWLRLCRERGLAGRAPAVKGSPYTLE